MKERPASQEHFIDPCRLPGEPTPAEADPTGETCCFERGAHKDACLSARLNGTDVSRIAADPMTETADLTKARKMTRNEGGAFMGDIKGGPFDVPGDLAREWLRLPANPNGRPNADVLKPWMNGMDVTRRPAGKWVVDFGWRMSKGEAALYEEPFRHVKERVRPMLQRGHHKARARSWWRHVSPGPETWKALDSLRRYIATPRVARHRLFVWLDKRVCPGHQLVVIARDDDTTFGILHSRFHEAWSLRLGTWLGKGNDPRYTPTAFETFPFPKGLSPDIPAADYADDPHATAIAEAARRLVELRDRWLNPPVWVEWIDEPVPGYPRRPVPCDETAARELEKRTLTALYNARPRWLVDAHAALDAAVAAAYGWPEDIADDDALRELLEIDKCPGTGIRSVIGRENSCR